MFKLITRWATIYCSHITSNIPTLQRELDRLVTYACEMLLNNLHAYQTNLLYTMYANDKDEYWMF